MLYASWIIHLFFYCYTILLIVAICLSWFPDWEDLGIVRFIKGVTDPYLRIFRRVIPPLGMVDLSPIVAFIALRLLERVLLLVLFR